MIEKRSKERKFRERERERERRREKRDFWKKINASLCITFDVQYI